MNSNPPAKRRGTWTQEDLEKAIEAVTTRNISDYKASEQFGVPRRTIRRYIQSNNTVKAKLGRKFALSSEENADLCSRIVRLAEIGYPITTKILRLCVYKYCLKNGIKHQFSNIKQIASHKWVRRFLKDNPTIALRKSQNLNPARAQKLNKFIVEDHFKTLGAILEKHNLLANPERIFNMDEKGCRLNLHKEPRVLAKKGVKRVHIVGNEHGENVTVVTCGNALGSAIPPMLLYKGKRMKPEFADDLPPGSVCCMTERGSMTSKTFVKWIEHFGKYKPTGLCLLIFDGAKSHLDFEIVEAAERNHILLYCLPSNTTHELQPLDKSVFRSFEYNWDQEVQLYWLNKGERVITKQRFGKIFSRVWDKSITPSNIKSGFKTCGIYPFDPSAIPEAAFAPSTATEMSPEENSATPTRSHTRTRNAPEECSSSPQPGPSNRPDVCILSDDEDDPVETVILNPTRSSEEKSDTENAIDTSFKDLMPTPQKKARKTSNRKLAINSRGVVLQKELFPASETTAAQPKDISRGQKAGTSHTKLGNQKKTVLTSKSKGTKKKESWFCNICQEDEIKDMRKCESCDRYVHEECVGLTKNDKGPFICPDCEP